MSAKEKKLQTVQKQSAITSDELVQLNQHYADATIAKEKFEHTITKGHLVRALYDVARLQSEVNLLKGESASRLKAEQQLRVEKEALTHQKAKEAQVEALAKELRSRYDVGDKFAIDPVTGEFVNPEI